MWGVTSPILKVYYETKLKKKDLGTQNLSQNTRQNRGDMSAILHSHCQPEAEISPSQFCLAFSLIFWVPRSFYSEFVLYNVILCKVVGRHWVTILSQLMYNTDVGHCYISQISR